MAAVIIDPNLLRDGNGTRRNIEANYEQENLNGNASIMNPIFFYDLIAILRFHVTSQWEKIKKTLFNSKK